MFLTVLVKTSFDLYGHPPISMDWSGTVSDTVADSQASPVPIKHNQLRPLCVPVNAPMSDFLCHLLADFQESLVLI